MRKLAGITMNSSLRAMAFVALVIAVLAVGTSTASAQTFYVRAGAGGNGSDWANAYSSLPATLVRGATYYVGAGSYGGYTFDDAVSGTSVISVKKATATDHGTATGWQAAYANPATFTGTVHFHTSYYLLDGQTRGSDWRSGYGFKVDPAGDSYGIQMGVPFNVAVSDITIRYVDVQGSGDDTGNLLDRGITSHCSASCAPSTNLTVSYSYVHDHGNVNFHLFRTYGMTIEYTWIERNHSDPVSHGEGIVCTEGCRNFVFRHNVMSDIEGTAFIATPTGGHPGCQGANSQNWYVYGNVFARPANPQRAGLGNGILIIFDHNHTGDFYFVNNSIVNVENGFVGFSQGGGGDGCATSAVVRNNIWYGVPGTVGRTGGVASLSWTHNAYFNTANSDPDPLKQTGNIDPFVDWRTGDFRLKVPTLAGSALGAPYNVDMKGITRGLDGLWDRGALEFGGGGTTPPPAAPTNLRIVR